MTERKEESMKLNCEGALQTLWRVIKTNIQVSLTWKKNTGKKRTTARSISLIYFS